MEYPTPLVPGIFINRPNRFIAEVLIDGKPVIVHVPNTGRCRELLLPQSKVLLSPAANSNRRTPYSLVAVYKGTRMINLDSQAPNKIILEALRAGLIPADEIRPEFFWGNSRLDIAYKRKGQMGFIEVKGVTLEEDDIAYFPDAPTLRGARHIQELILAQEQGYAGHLWFVIQMEDIKHFQPNDQTDPSFGQVLREGAKAGLDIRAWCCRCSPQSITLDNEVPVIL